MGMGRKLSRNELAASNLELKVGLLLLKKRKGLGRSYPGMSYLL
jgi:hypothetical protein